MIFLTKLAHVFFDLLFKLLFNWRTWAVAGVGALLWWGWGEAVNHGRDLQIAEDAKIIEPLREKIGHLEGVIHKMTTTQQEVERHNEQVVQFLTAQAAQTKEKVRYVEKIVEKVREVVTPAADAQCAVPDGFVWLHDASARGENPEASDAADHPRDVEAASGIPLSQVGEVVAQNYASCHADRGALRLWQEWFKEWSRIYATVP